jgi:hypothetical protein
MTSFELAVDVATPSVSFANMLGQYCYVQRAQAQINFMPRHGPFGDCTRKSIIAEYLAVPEDSPSRVLLERRYGKAKLMAQIAEKRNLEWIGRSTKACPKCHVHVEKSHGCNHVRCQRPKMSQL